MGFFVMGDHGVNVSGFVHLVAAIVVKSGANASFTGEKPPVLPESGEVLKKPHRLNVRLWCIRTAGDL
jgi:hypothetical protein